jgi:hypothetical protein
MFVETGGRLLDRPFGPVVFLISQPLNASGEDKREDKR